MTAASYQLLLRRHLARYKREVLGVVDDGTWRYRGKDIRYPHILPAGMERLNVIEMVREEFWAYWTGQELRARQPAKLHRNFAHLTSSQACAFNLFFPFLGSSHAAPQVLLRMLGIAEEPVANWSFEALLDSREGTNFDVAVTLASGRRVLVEVKLTESEFGRCRDDPKHREKLANIYAPRLEGKVPVEVTRPREFFTRYQILRNISYADGETTVVFLVPRANEALVDGTAFVNGAVMPSSRKAVRVVYLEELVARLSHEVQDPFLDKALSALRRKYVLPV